MITLYDNPFSPFTRKVRMVLNHKEIPYKSTNALTHKARQDFSKLYPRAEVPMIVDGHLQITNSPDIISYLEDAYPQNPVFPEATADRVSVRHWQRVADTLFDAILHDISIWSWPMLNRQDAPPAGLFEAGKKDALQIASAWNAAIGDKPFLCDAVSVADFAMFTHVSALKFLGIELNADEHGHIQRWLKNMRQIPCVQKDLEDIRSFLEKGFAAKEKKDTSSDKVDHGFEKKKIFWRGDRLEWLFHHGFMDWWLKELKEGRAVVPEPLV